MKHPLDEFPWPKSPTLEIGNTYQLPFEFVVPSEIPHQVCRHLHRHEQVHWEHCQLPPSIGSHPRQSQLKHKILDDLAPETLNIRYRVRFQVFETSNKTGITRAIGEWTQPVHILPSRNERAPLLVPVRSKHYCLSKQKRSWGLYRRQLGTLSVKAEQPPAIQVRSKRDAPATMITMNLQYTTISGSPPALKSIHPRLNILNFCAQEPWPDFPNVIDSELCPWHHVCDPRAVPLQACPLESVKWQIYPSDNIVEHQKGYTTHAASLQVPIILPRHLVYPPTIFSCLVGRAYSVKLSLSYCVKEQWIKTSKITVAVPVQIC